MTKKLFDFFSISVVIHPLTAVCVFWSLIIWFDMLMDISMKRNLLFVFYGPIIKLLFACYNAFLLLVKIHNEHWTKEDIENWCRVFNYGLKNPCQTRITCGCLSYLVLAVCLNATPGGAVDHIRSETCIILLLSKCCGD